MQIKKSYINFIGLLTTKNIISSLQYDDLENGYKLYFPDGGFVYTCNLNYLENEADITDFETNYKDNANGQLIKIDSYGHQIVSPTIEDTMGLYPKKHSYKNTATAGMTNFFDVEVDTEKQICGGEYWVYSGTPHENDYVEFSIIDKNDILGLFTLYGLTVGVDILELTKFVAKDYVIKGTPGDNYHSKLYEGIKGSNAIMQGLFFRSAYTSAGTEDLNFIWRLYYYE